MSRCFPYPPPGYVGSKSGNGALIESIKLQRESEKAKSERKKEKKREKEKRDRKEKEKDKLKKNLIQDGKSSKSVVDSTEFFKEKKREDSDEQMARSDLTEEHAQPINIHKPSYSSDSTENSNKRKRHASPPPSGITAHGNVIRIRLPLRKHSEPNLVKENQSSTSGRTELTASLRRETHVRGELVDDKNKRPSCPTSGIEIDPQVRTPKPIALSLFDEEQQRVNLLYKELIGCWVLPAPLKELTDADDQEWLFGQKHQDERQGKKHKPSSDLSCRNSFGLCSGAQYLPEADIYALPYTLPF